MTALPRLKNCRNHFMARSPHPAPVVILNVIVTSADVTCLRLNGCSSMMSVTSEMPTSAPS